MSNVSTAPDRRRRTDPIDEGGPQVEDSRLAEQQTGQEEGSAGEEVQTAVVDASELNGADLGLQIGNTAAAWLLTDVLHVSADGWTGAVTPHAADALPIDIATENPFGPYVAAWPRRRPGVHVRPRSRPPPPGRRAERVDADPGHHRPWRDRSR